MPTQEQIDGWNAWVADLPEKVREVAERFKPWHLYRLAPGGHRVTVYSFDEPETADEGEDVTLKVMVLNQYNDNLAFERKVFGIKPDDLQFLEDLSL